jgi:hypothetical protein
MTRRRSLSSLLVVALSLSTVLALAAARPGTGVDRPGSSRPIVGPAVPSILSPAARDVSSSAPTRSQVPVRVNPLAGQPDSPWRATWDRAAVPTDPLIRPPVAGPRTPAPTMRFLGVGNPLGCGGCSPPDPNGDVGPNHYVQMVNATKVAAFNKTGTLLAAPFDLGSLWPSGICASNAGDPIVRYDGLADRWLLSQFASPSHMCIAISVSPNPLGSYHLYTFNVGTFPDYFKFGVWPDAYYMSANEATYTAYAFDRAKMLAGQAATFVKFTGETNFLMPADLDGPIPPPAGTPGLFTTFKDDAFHGGGDRLEVFALHADFVTPANSTFTLEATLPIASFAYTVCGFFNFNCANQPGTARRLDVVSEWPMQRFPYRNFGDHQTLLGNFTVGGGTGEVGAAIRWFELRDTGSGWALYQEGTLDPGDGNDRFMGSIAMDGAGDIALGYTVSSSTMFPSIRYATRIASNPLGQLGAERPLIGGRGSQTGSNRWGDYSAMSVDPSNDCSFWYTNEFYTHTASTDWRTLIGTFTIPSC